MRLLPANKSPTPAGQGFGYNIDPVAPIKADMHMPDSLLLVSAKKLHDHPGMCSGH
jgi:hypothetical protein